MPRAKKKTYEESLSEKVFQSHVMQTARLNGFRVPREDPLAPSLDLVVHIYDSRKSAGAGYPDLTLLHPGRSVLYLVELKSEKGRLTPEQKLWRAALEPLEDASGGIVRYRLWRPSMWPEIIYELGGKDSRLFV